MITDHLPKTHRGGCFFVLTAVLQMASAPSVARAEATTLSGADYAALCESRGVPLPPQWGSSAWDFRGTLNDNQEFILGARVAHVYTYENASGICFALPRVASALDRVGRASFGVICQGTSGKVCFWDNTSAVDWDARNGTTVYSERKHIASTDAALLDGTFIGGADLVAHIGGECTDCHSGKNPFIIHPGSALDIGPAVNGSGVWYEPIVSGLWLQNPGPGSPLANVPLGPGDSSCLTCHTGSIVSAGRFPTLTDEHSGFCRTVLQISRERGMMPNSSSYATHWNALEAACENAPPPPDPSTRDPIKPWTLSSVWVQRYDKWSRVWGESAYADVNATADEYCRLKGFQRSTSYETNVCGEDESYYLRFDPTDGVWESRRSGSTNRCYQMLSSVGCDGVRNWGSRSNVYVVNDHGSSRKLWGESNYADVSATANQYCKLLGYERAMSWNANTCGEDESYYHRYNPTTNLWESRRSGSTNRCYSLLSNINCSN